MNYMDAVRVGILGCGTVGGGVVRVLAENHDETARKLGIPIVVKKILVRDMSRERPVRLDPNVLTIKAGDILDDDEIDVVVEVMGGVNPARQYVLSALNRGKHVVTANKELVAKHGGELWEAAERTRAAFRFEGSVAAGIPIIKALHECLASNRICEISGIVNGTTNYILTKMAREGREFEDALAEAQQKGYAESNPSSDIDGLDAAYKLAILASVGFGVQVAPEQVYAEGIGKVCKTDIQYARELGYEVKLLAIAKLDGAGLQVRVHPTFIPTWHPLASVSDSFNAIFVRGNAVGSLMFYGRGAGAGPTASAVISDIMDVARGLSHNGRDYRPEVFKPWGGHLDVQPMEETETRYYVRLQVVDRPGVLAVIAKAFGDNRVSLESVIQKGTGSPVVGLVFITHVVKERHLRSALALIRALSVVQEIASVIRVEAGIEADREGARSANPAGSKRGQTRRCR
ncbi:MAG: homoserine dehydrogenase [Clostridia bacterium]